MRFSGKPEATLWTSGPLPCQAGGARNYEVFGEGLGAA